MPLVHSEKIEANTTLFIWKLSETESELRNAFRSDFNVEDLETISHPQKVKEWLGSRLLLKNLVENVGLTYNGTRKDEHGKVYLSNSGAHISITHTFDYVAAVINERSEVGIDMERKSEKLQRIAHKFLSDDEFEQADMNIRKLVMYWCAKEAIYKKYGKKKISFKDDIFIKTFQPLDSILQGKVTDLNQVVEAQIFILWVEDYCLAIAC